MSVAHAEAGAARPRLELKFLAEAPNLVGPDGVFEGYASLFGVADLGRDTVMPGAFRVSLARRGADAIRMLWQHDPAEPIGRWLSVAEDEVGLRVRGRLNLTVRRAREIASLMREGAVDGLSIGFRTLDARPERGGRRLVRLDLWEISLVTFPMLPGARVAAAPVVRAAAALGRQSPDLHLAQTIRRAALALRRNPFTSRTL